MDVLYIATSYCLRIEKYLCFCFLGLGLACSLKLWILVKGLEHIGYDWTDSLLVALVINTYKFNYKYHKVKTTFNVLCCVAALSMQKVQPMKEEATYNMFNSL